MIDVKQFRPKFFKPTELEENRVCLKCPTKLPRWVKYYCSGMCINAAKVEGSYGNEIDPIR